MQFSDYLAAISSIELLAPQMEKEMWKACKGGDLKARARLIESYQPLVCKQVMPWRSRPDIMDAVQEGTVGLIEALESYQPERGVAFSLYAMHRIRGRVLDFLRKEGGADIACLEAMSTDDGNTINLKEGIADRVALTVPEQVENAVFAERLHRALDRLPGKEKAVLEGMYLDSADAREMADALSVSLSHVYRLRETGIRRVRGMLSRFKSNW